MRVRLATQHDLAGVRELYKVLRPNDPELPPAVARERWSIIISSPGVHIVVAEEAERLMSTCMLAFIPNLASGGRSIGVIEHVVTLPPYRGRGLGRQVLRYALDLAWYNNCCKVMLLSGLQRTEAHRLYESVGFKGDIERGFVVKRQ